MARIGIDVDGVLYHWEKTARYLLREVLPDSPYPKSGRLGAPSDHWNTIPDYVAPEHWKWLWNEGVEKGLFRNGHVMHGALEGCRKLKALGHELIIITHRPAAAVNDTLAWLSFQQLDLSGVHIQTNREPKSSVRPMCDVYVDDKIENVVDLAKNTKARLVALYDQPWNQETYQAEAHWGIKRVHGWSDFVDKVQEL